MSESLFPEGTIVENEFGIPIGHGWSMRKTEGFPPKVILYRLGVLVKTVDISDKTAKRLMIVELVEQGVTQSRLAKGLGISRQSIHNYLQSQKHFGREGLVHGYSAKKRSGLTDERKKHSSQRSQGNKARETAAIRAREKKHLEREKQERQEQLNYSFGHDCSEKTHKPTAIPVGIVDEAAAEKSKEEPKQSEEVTKTEPSAKEVITTGDAAKDEPLAIDEVKVKDTPELSPERVEKEEGKGRIVSEKADDCEGPLSDEAPKYADNISVFSNAEAREAGQNLFAEKYDWQATRFAGIFCYLIALISEWKWLHLVLGHFGQYHQIFSVFLLMAARNIRSIDRLKDVRSREASLILGLEHFPSVSTIWTWFYNASRLKCSSFLLFDYFRYQIRVGLVSVYSWFIDGHLLPYTGQEKVRQAFNTQRKMPEPGRTNLVTCDATGRIVDFEIQEGKGDLRTHISTLLQKWKYELTKSPLMVFDREGHGKEFFFDLVTKKISFITWEKHKDKAKLSAIEADKYTEEFELNHKTYRVFEEPKTFSIEHAAPDMPDTKFTVTRIHIWNQSTNHRTCGLSWCSDKTKLSLQERTCQLLTRWAASENTFKHLQERHPLHYHPGFSMNKSDNQEIANPELKANEKQTAQIQKQINTLAKKIVKAKSAVNKDGTPRQGSRRERLKTELKEQEAKLNNLQAEKKQLSTRVNVSSLSNYKSFKKIDNEGKNLFDFVTTSVWNARKQMVDFLRSDFKRQSEVVALFYAITECHGWIKSTAAEVRVRLEPLQQSKRYAAQERLCRNLTGRLAQLPNGKWLAIEVGEAPNVN